MERRRIAAGIALVAALLLALALASTASAARKTHTHRVLVHTTSPAGTAAPETCVVLTEPGSFMDTGEFEAASSIADLIAVECEPVYAEKYVRISATELYNRCDHRLGWTEGVPLGEAKFENAPSFRIKLDNDGNGGAIVFGGPSCAAGESLVSAHLESPPYTTVTTGFTVLPPGVTPVGVTAEPSIAVEGEETSSLATIVKVEFPPVFAEEEVDINASQLYARCHKGPKLAFVPADGGVEGETVTFGEETTVKLDNDGNAFVVLAAGESCASGEVLIEASLVNAPYTTYTTTLKVEPPVSTFP